MKSPLFFTALVLTFSNLAARAEDVVILQLEKHGSALPPVVIELFEADAPRHSANFKKLASNGFYKRTAIHRILPGALVQMGDPISRKKDAIDLGTGGPGYTLAPEIKRKHSEAVVGMGRLPDKVNPGRLSNGSQFYITLKPLPELDGTQTVFGKVTHGIEALQDLGKSATDTNDAPLERLTVRQTKIVSKESLGRELQSMQTGKSNWWNRVTGSIPRLF
jgi:cyclophilin family peptidyl-prolyl cis-trans isomerase